MPGCCLSAYPHGSPKVLVAWSGRCGSRPGAATGRKRTLELTDGATIVRHHSMLLWITGVYDTVRTSVLSRIGWIGGS